MGNTRLFSSLVRVRLDVFPVRLRLIYALSIFDEVPNYHECLLALHGGHTLEVWISIFYLQHSTDQVLLLVYPEPAKQVKLDSLE